MREEQDLWYGNKVACTHAYMIRKWCPTQRTAARQCCEQLFNKGKFVGMKTLSVRRALRCDKHQFCAENMVNT